MPPPPFTAHVVSHTHWDREWYRTFQEFRRRLVDLMDFLIDLMENDPTYRHFYLDGQTIVLDDYMEIRPENRARLQALIDSGRIYAGPWYVQPDEFLVSAEATIRNLLLGKRQGEEWGTWAKIGYAPDAFGHISQTPQILRGFGIDNAVLFRGVTTDQADSEFTWRSPDGSEVLCVKMPDDTAYSNFYYHLRDTLKATPGSGAACLEAELNEASVLAQARGLYDESVAQRPNTDALLWMDGVDHIFPQPRTPRIIAIVNEGMRGEVTAVHSTLPDFVAAVRARNPQLKTITGELRHSNRAWKLQALLADTASSRIHLKQRNNECETLLERYAEPFAAVASRLGKPYPGAFLGSAWKYLLQNQPHDSICGCSIDQVHRDMLPRYDQCEQIGEMVVRESLTHIASQVDTSAPLSPSGTPENPVRPLMPEPLCALVVFNPLGWPRTEIVETVVELPSRLALEDGQIAVRGANAESIPCEITPLRDYHTLNQDRHDIPVGEIHKRWTVRFAAVAPAFGCQTYYVVPEAPVSVQSGIVVSHRSIENAFVKVEIADDNTVSITDKETGRTIPGGHVFENGGDDGEGWNYVKPAKDRVVNSKGNNHDAVLSSCMSVFTGGLDLVHYVNMTVPRRGERGRFTPQYSSVLARYRLSPTSKNVRVTLFCDNSLWKNHRLRILFPTCRNNATHSYAEQAFDVVSRPISVPEGTGWKEPPHGRFPMKTFVDVNDSLYGFALLSKGIPQYEVFDDQQRTIALTLLRAVGNGVGTPEQQEDGQMPGHYTFEFALFPHAGDWEQARVWQEGHAFNAPMRAVQTGLHAGRLPRRASFIETGADTLVATSLKGSEDGSGLVFRAFNIGTQPVEPEIKPAEFLHLGAPTRVRMDETPDPEAAAILPPKRVATWKFA